MLVDRPRRRKAAAASGLPLNHYDALPAVAVVGDDHRQAGGPYKEEAKLSHGLYVQRNAVFNFDPHLIVAAVEAFLQIIDGRRFVSRLHSLLRLALSQDDILYAQCPVPPSGGPTRTSVLSRATLTVV